MRRPALLILFVIALELAPAAGALAVEEQDASLALEGGGFWYGGKLGELLAADGAFGLNIAYGFTDYFAIDLDFLYSENQQSDKEKYGEISFTQGQAAIGARVSYTTDYLAPYLTLAPIYTLMSYKATYDAGDVREQDTLKSHGFGGSATAGLDFLASSTTALGLAARVGIVSTDMQFATGADIDNRIRAYTFYAGLFRLTLIF